MEVKEVQSNSNQPDSNNLDTCSSDKQMVNKHDLVPGPKRKAAMLLAYCGEAYHGMVMNRGQREIKTIEGALLKALVKARVVPENCWEDPKKMSYRIASRTDKGVSTCGQVASLKLIIHNDVVNLINEHLPDDIRILAVKRATQGFSSQFCAHARTYSYTLPTYAFANDPKVGSAYRITQEKLDHIHSIAYRYKGTHSYHNFTSGKMMGEMSSKRYIMEFYNDPPFLKESTQFLTFRIKGQSFMIHQIRKMIGLIITIVGGYATEDYFIQAFSEPLADIPKAPGTGLVLEQIHYDSYNQKHGHLHGGIDFSDVQDKIEEFRQTRILPYIYKSEIEQSGMMEWLDTLLYHDFSGERAREDWKRQNAMMAAEDDSNSVDGILRIETSSTASSRDNEKNENLQPEEHLDEPLHKKTKTSSEIQRSEI